MNSFQNFEQQYLEPPIFSQIYTSLELPQNLLNNEQFFFWKLLLPNK